MELNTCVCIKCWFLVSSGLFVGFVDSKIYNHLNLSHPFNIKHPASLCDMISGGWKSKISYLTGCKNLKLM